MNIVIPVRSVATGKTRLASALDQRARKRLIERMFLHVLAQAQALGPTHVVSRDPHLLALARARHARTVAEQGDTLNLALTQVARAAPPDEPLLALSADLPLLTEEDLRAMILALDKADVVAAPDRAGTGTNALLLSRPGLIDYAFGCGSLDAHRAASASAGLRFAAVERPGLACDIDLPGDLALLGPAFLSAA